MKSRLSFILFISTNLIFVTGVFFEAKASLSCEDLGSDLISKGDVSQLVISVSDKLPEPRVNIATASELLQFLNGLYRKNQGYSDIFLNSLSQRSMLFFFLEAKLDVYLQILIQSKDFHLDMTTSNVESDNHNLNTHLLPRRLSNLLQFNQNLDDQDYYHDAEVFFKYLLQQSIEKKDFDSGFITELKERGLKIDENQMIFFGNRSSQASVKDQYQNFNEKLKATLSLLTIMDRDPNSINALLASVRLQSDSLNSDQRVEERKRFFTNELWVNEKGEKTFLRFSWRIFNSESSVNGPVANFRSVSDSATDYFASLRSNPVFAAVHRMFGSLWNPYSAQFYENVYKNYPESFKDNILPALHDADSKLDYLRASYGRVWKYENFEQNRSDDEKDLQGTIRVYDGSRLRPFELFNSTAPEDVLQRAFAVKDFDLTAQSDRLPWQRLMDVRGLKSKASADLDNLKRQTPWLSVFEIGKLTLVGSSAMRAQVMKLMEFWLYHYYASLYPHGIFYVHVATDAHLRLYQKKYQMNIIDTIVIPGTDHKEYVLVTSGKTLASRLKEINNF